MIAVKLPSGDTIQVDTDDPKAAAAAARKYLAAQPPPKKSFGDTVWDTMAGAGKKLADDVKADYEASGRVLRGQAKPGTSDYGRLMGIAGDVAAVAASPFTGVQEALVVQPAAHAFDKVPLQSYQAPTVNPNARGGDPSTWLTPARPMNPAETHAANAGMVRNALAVIGPPRPGVPPVAAPAVAPNALAKDVAMFDRVGVEPSLAAVKGGAASTVANLSAENIAGFRPRAQMARQAGQANSAADRIAAGYGEARGAQITGERVQEGVERFAGSARSSRVTNTSAPASRSSFKAKADELYDRAFAPVTTAEQQAIERAANDHAAATDAAIKAQAAETSRRQAAYESAAKAEADRVASLRARGYTDIPPAEVPRPDPVELNAPAIRPAVTPTQTITTLKDIAGRVNAPKLSNMITDSRPREIMKALESDAHEVRFNDLRELRTWVRNARGNPELMQGIGSAGLERLEGALTQDIYSNAERLAGPKALHQLQRVDQFYRAGAQRVRSALQPFADAKSGETAYSRILQAAGSTGGADAQKLLSLKRSLAPDEWGDVAANIVKEMGAPTKGAAGVTNEDAFSVSSFVTNYAKLSPRGRDVLFGSVGGGGKNASELRVALDDLARVADKLKAVEKGANVSKSGVNFQNVLAIAGLASGGMNPAYAAWTLKTMGGLALTGEAMTNPKFVRWLARTPQAARSAPGWQAHLATLGTLARADATLAPLFQKLSEAPALAPAQAAAEQAPQQQR